MTKDTFITAEQLEQIAESMCGTCYTMTHYFDSYQKEFDLTDDQMEELESVLVPEYHAQNEIFLCEQCGWWSYGGETQGENGECSECSECAEENE